MDPVTGAIVGSGISSGGGIISTLLTNRANRKLTEAQWERDDTAHQREVADMKAAGLNPLLSAGGAGAQSSAPIPMKGADIADFGGAVVAGEQAKTQQKAQQVQSALADQNLKNLQVQKRIMNLDEAQKANDLLLNIKRGTRSNDSGMFNQIAASIVYALDLMKKHGGASNMGLQVARTLVDPVKKAVRSEADRKVEIDSKRKEEIPKTRESDKGKTIEYTNDYGGGTR